MAIDDDGSAEAVGADKNPRNVRPDSLRVTFDIMQTPVELWWAEIDISNPNLQTIKTLDAGCTVSVSAGYAVERAPAEIFRGPIFQAIFSKPDSTTTILRLLCFVELSQCRKVFNVMRGDGPPGVSDNRRAAVSRTETKHNGNKEGTKKAASTTQQEAPPPRREAASGAGLAV